MMLPHDMTSHVSVRMIDRADNDSIPTPDDFNHIYGLIEDVQMAQQFAGRLVADIAAAIGQYNWMLIFTQSLQNDTLFNFDVIAYSMEHCTLVKKIVKQKLPNAGECMVCSLRA